MTIESNLRARAAYMEKYGFSAELGETDGPCCFIGCGPDGTRQNHKATRHLADTVFDGDWCEFGYGSLKREGWATEDAIAALTIAADIALEEGI